MQIRRAHQADIDSIAQVYQACFPNELKHRLWVQSSMNCYPRGVYYVVERDGEICGYCLWCIKNGFRSRTIVELEQLGVHPDWSGKGLGRKLIEASIDMFKAHVTQLGLQVGAVLVTTSDGNFAEQLYQSTLGVERSAVISGYGSGDEVILYTNRVNQV